MRKLRLLAFSVLAMLFMVNGVSAATVDVDSSEKLINCFLSDGNTCKLTSDVTLAEKVQLRVEKNVDIILDLNGKTLSLADVDIADLPVEQQKYSVMVGGSLVIQGNGTVNVPSTFGIGVGTSGSLTIKNGTFEQEDGSYLVGNWGTTVIENGTFNADYCAVNGFSGKSTIKNGTFNSNPEYDEETQKSYYWGVLGTVEVQNGTFNQVLTWSGLLTNSSEVTYKLEDDNNLYESLVLTGNITIDLNGHDIIQTSEKTNVFSFQNGELNITGKGNIVSGKEASNAIRILGSTDVNDKDYTIVTIDKDVTVESYGYAAFVTHNNSRAYGVEINILGTLNGGYSGFYVNGNIQDVDDNDFTNFPVINIEDSAVISGIYAGGYATWNIGKALIEDTDYGLGIKAGKFVIDGATISGTGKMVKPTGNGDGINGTGAGLQFETNAGYADNIEVTIKNATVSSKNGYAVLEYLGQTKILSLTIENGTFKSADGLDIFSTSEEFDLVKFIKGGKYSADVKKYIATGLVSKKVDDMYVVAKENNVTLGEITNGTVTIDKTKAIVGESVTITLTPNKGYELNTVKVVDENNKEVVVTDNKFVMPASNVTITASFKSTTVTTVLPVIDTTKEVEEVIVGIEDEAKVEEVLLDTIAKDEDLAAKLEDSSVTVKVEIEKMETSNVDEKVVKAIEEKAGNAIIADYFDITIAVRNDAGTVNETISELSKEIELVVALPKSLKEVKEGLARKYYIVREHDGKAELLNAEVSKDGKSLTFKTNKFSTYAIAYVDSEVVTPPETGDNIMLYVVLGLVAIIGVGLISKKVRKSN